MKNNIKSIGFIWLVIADDIFPVNSYSGSEQAYHKTNINITNLKPFQHIWTNL